MQNIKERTSNFELLRLLLMFYITIHHCIVLALGLGGIDGLYGWQCHLRSEDIPLMFLTNAFLIVAVDVFVLISGYFSIKLKGIRLWELFFSLIFFTILFTSLPQLFKGDVKHAILYAMPLSQTRYWFIREYFFLVLFAPMLNMYLENLDKKSHLRFIGLLAVICCYVGFLWRKSIVGDGYNFVNFILLYTIGRYIKLYSLDISRRKSLLLYIGLSLLIGTISVLFWSHGMNGWAWRMTDYSNPLLILSAIGLFSFFLQLKIKSSLINRWSKSSLSIFLFTSSLLISQTQYKWILESYKSGLGGVKF